MIYSDLNLKYNPFEDIVPSQDNLHWAGMKRQKDQIEQIYKEAFERRTRQIVLNWGPWGGGKTFAAEYFTKMPKPAISSAEEKFISIIVSAPQDGTDVIKSIIEKILATFSPEFLGKNIAEAITNLNKDVLLKKIYNRIQNYEIANVIVNLCDPNSSHGSSYFNAGNLLLKYFYNSFDKKQLSQLKINKPLKGNDDYLQFLAGVLIALTSTSLEKKIFLWIDEMEQLFYYTAKQYRAISQLIRDLTDKVNENFTVFLNLTLSENDINKINILLGSALISRINKDIKFRDLTIEDALDYCKDLINYASIQHLENLYYPLTENILRELIKTLSKEKIIPREINKLCYGFINFLKEENVEMVTLDTIELYQKHLIHGN